MKMKITQNKMMTALLALTVIVIAYLYVPQYMTIISPPTQIWVDPQGENVGGEWQGSFWNMLVAVTSNDQVAGLLLPKDTSTTVDFGTIQETLTTGANIEIRIDPLQPYLIRKLSEKPVRVSPQVGQTYVNRFSPSWKGEELNDPSRRIEELWLNYYDWSDVENSFRIYSPFIVTVLKEGIVVGTQTFNTQGGSNKQIIPTNEGNIQIENLGSLQGIYLTPTVPDQIAIIKGYPNVYDWTQIMPIVEFDRAAVYTQNPTYPPLSVATGVSNTYASYWFGTNWRWTDNKHPAGVVGIGTSSNIMVSTSLFGGWTAADDSQFLRRNPVRPVIGDSDKASLIPYGKDGFRSLLNYIEFKGVQNLAPTIFSNYQGASITTEDGQLALKLPIPWNAYGTPMVNIRVPTELADTWVDMPTIGDVEPEATWLSSGTKHAEILDTDTLQVVLTQKTSYTSTTNLYVKVNHNRVGIYPLQGSYTVAPNNPQTITFQVENLGTETRIDNIPITIECYDAYTNELTGSDTVTLTLLPNIIHGITVLNIFALEKGTTIPAQGLQVSTSFGGKVLNDFTGTYGRITLTLESNSGGGYIGPVSIASAETDRYLPASNSINIPTTGVYDITLEVPLKGQKYDEDWWIWIVVAAVAVSILMFGFGYFGGNKKLFKRRRKR